MKILSEESGNVLILTALSMTMLISFLGMAIDVGNLFYTQRQLQTLADSAAMAGALEASACSGTNNCAVIQTAATTALTEGGSSTPTLFLQCASASGTGLLLTINNGPCALGTSDPNNANANYVEAVVSKQTPTFFAKIFGVNTFNISARAEAGKSVAATPCMNITGTSGATLTLNSGATIKDGAGSTCGIYDNSSASGGCSGPAVWEDSGASVNVGSYNVRGNVCDNGGSYTPTPTTGAPAVADPFKAEITAGTLSTPTKGPSRSTSPIDRATTLSSGYYSGGLNFNSGTYTVTLNPGVYYMDGSVNISTGVTLSGTGVTIYMASGQLNMNSGSNMILTAPTSGSTAGLVIWQPASNTNEMNLDSSSDSSWSGGVYIPGAELTFNSGSNATAFGMIVAQSLTVDSNASIVLSCTYMPGGVCPGGGTSSGGGSTTIALAE